MSQEEDIKLVATLIRRFHLGESLEWSDIETIFDILSSYYKEFDVYD